MGLLGMYFDAVVVEVGKCLFFFQVGSGHTVSSVLNRKRSDKCSSHVIAMKSSTALSVSPSIVSTSKSAGFSCTKLSGSGDTHWVDFNRKMAKNNSLFVCCHITVSCTKLSGLENFDWVQFT